MVVPGMVVSITVMRVKLWMLGIPSLRWSGRSVSFVVLRVVVLMVFHVALSCPWKCLVAYLNNGRGFQTFRHSTAAEGPDYRRRFIEA